jgi:hypothetical protein
MLPRAVRIVCALLVSICGAHCTSSDGTKQEITAEAQKVWLQDFTRCGEDFFAKETNTSWSEREYTIHQYKKLDAMVSIKALTPADTLNEVAWNATIEFTSGTERQWMVRPPDTLRPQRVPAWSEWRNGDSRPFPLYRVSLEKRHGQVIVHRPPTWQLTAIPCSEVPH